MNFSIWTAVSSAAQAEDDKESLPEQERKCRAAGLARGWVETVPPYIIPGESRTRWVNLRDAEDSIPPLRAMLEDAKAGKFHILILYDYNRLRDLLDPVAKTLASYGVQLYSVNQPTEPLPPEDFNPYASDSESMMRGMSQIISRWQIADLRRKYRFGVRGRVESGLPSLKIPYGYTKPPGRETDRKVIPIPHPVHSQIVIDMKERFLAGMPIHDLADYLTERYPTPSGIPAWSRTSIQHMIRNPFYAGKVSFGARLTVHDPRLNKKKLVSNPDPLTHDGRHTPLWSYEDHLAIQVELARRSSLPTTARYPWSGLLSCAECDHNLRRKVQRYSCIHCHTVTIWDHELPEIIPPAIQSALRNVQPLDLTPGTTPPNSAAILEDLDRKRKKIQQGYEAELYTITEANEKLKEIESKVSALKNTGVQSARAQAERLAFNHAIEDIAPLLDSLPQWIIKDDPKVVSSLLLRLFKTVKITHERKAIPVLRG
jgi:DNA invertase Pin-like site-specific DNA recombinase